MDFYSLVFVSLRTATLSFINSESGRFVWFLNDNDWPLAKFWRQEIIQALSLKGGPHLSVGFASNPTRCSSWEAKNLLIQARSRKRNHSEIIPNYSWYNDLYSKGKDFTKNIYEGPSRLTKTLRSNHKVIEWYPLLQLTINVFSPK